MSIPFPMTPEDKAAADRHLRKLQRANALARGKVQPNARERAQMQRRADQKRGWRVMVPGRVDEPVSNIVGVDPGSSGGFAWWTWCGPDDEDYELSHCGDGVPDFPQLVPFEGRTVELGPCLVVLEGQTGFRHTGRRGTNVSEHTAGRNWGHAAGMLEAVCRDRGWPMIAVPPRTWQRAMGVKAVGRLTTKQVANNALAGILNAAGRPLDMEQFWGPRGGLRDGRVDAGCIGWWAAQHLPAILEECTRQA